MPNFRNAQLNPNEYRNSYCHQNEFRCIQCGFRIKRLFLQYSPGNIRLMKCENCKAVADDYIECEIMILLIDLILHKPKAYRHLVCNLVNQENMNMEAVWWKSLISFLFLDVCIHFINLLFFSKLFCSFNRGMFGQYNVESHCSVAFFFNNNSPWSSKRFTTW